jgi:hypothetical protein
MISNALCVDVHSTLVPILTTATQAGRSEIYQSQLKRNQTETLPEFKLHHYLCARALDLNLVSIDKCFNRICGYRLGKEIPLNGIAPERF